MADREIIICRDAAEVAHKAAEQWVVLGRQAIDGLRSIHRGVIRRLDAESALFVIGFA